jgi:inner membrane protein
MDFFKQLLRPDMIWFLVAALLFLLELIAPGLILMFFGLGACFTAVVCLRNELSLNSQLLVFLGSSIMFLVCLRWWLKKVFTGLSPAGKEMGTSCCEYLGEQATVKERIPAGLRGKVEFHGSDWQAQADEAVEPGTIVEIVGQENLVLKVRPLGSK